MDRFRGSPPGLLTVFMVWFGCMEVEDREG